MGLRLLLLLTGVLLWPVRADADVRRCQTPTGHVIYTDRGCETVGAVERPEPPRPAPGPASWICPRSVRDLIAEVAAAIDSGDADRLVRLHHWDGLSHEEGYRIADRLQAIAERPLIGVAPIQPEAEAPGDGQRLTTERRPPLALRIQQVAREGDEVVVSTLGVHRHLGCWWLRL